MSFLKTVSNTILSKSVILSLSKDDKGILLPHFDKLNVTSILEKCRRALVVDIEKHRL
jgi:hypothetical protein